MSGFVRGWVKRRGWVLGLALAVVALALGGGWFTTVVSAPAAVPGVSSGRSSSSAASISSSPDVGASTMPVAPPPALQAASAVLLDLDTGRVLFTQKAHERRPPGGLTKIVAALVVLQRGHLDEKVRIGRDAVNAPGYGLRFEEGDELPLGALLTSMLFHPGTDAAIAIAEHIAGSSRAFAGQMEAAARQSGAERSGFRSPHGLDEAGHQSTAFDLALIAHAALEIPEFARLVSQRRALVPWRERGRDLRNFNSFLWRFPGARGVVSSYTPGSGHSIIAAARRGERDLLAVVMGAPSADARWLDAASLLEYGFANYQALSEAPLVEKVSYEVQEGDTLTSLARRFEVPLAAIRALNGLEDPDRLAAGTRLWIPR